MQQVTHSSRTLAPRFSMPFSTTKDKIPKGFAYLLKSAALQEALLARGVSTNVHLAYRMSQRLFKLIEWF